MLALVSWKFAESPKGGPHHFYCCECKSYLRVVSSMGADLHNVSWLRKYKHPCYNKSWDKPMSKYHHIRVIYPEMIYSVTKDMKNKDKPLLCPMCKNISLIVPALNSQFDIALLKASFREKKSDDQCTACCSSCQEMVTATSWQKIPQLRGKYYCASCFVKAE